MAKRKLSGSQRSQLRSALAKGVKAGRAVAELVAEAAKKYGITTVSARWYLKGAGGKPKKASKRKTVSRRGTARVKIARNGVLPRFLRVVALKAAEVAERAKEAKRLFPEWRSLVKKEHHLRSVQTQVKRELTSVARRAKSLGAKIKGLVGT
jgi:hypothetical protein